MFRLLPRINIAGQLTLLVTVVAGLAISVVSWVAETNGRSLLIKRGLSNLVDESQLEGIALREGVRNLTRTVRGRANDIERSLGPGTTNGLAQEGILRKLFLDRDDSVEGDLTTITEASLVLVQPNGEIRNQTVLRAAPAGPVKVTGPVDAPTGPATEEVWRQLRREGRGRPEASSETLLSDLHRIESSEGVHYRLVIGCPLAGTTRPEGRLVVLVTIDFTLLVANQARHLPRHLLFVRTRDGVCVYHPDPKQIGQSKIPTRWEEVGTASSGEGEEPVRRVELPEVHDPDLAYLTVRFERIAPLTQTRQACAVLEQELALPGLRHSLLYEGATTVVLSCADEPTLYRARELIRQQLGVPATSKEPIPLRCTHFVGQRLPRVFLDGSEPTAREPQRTAPQALAVEVILAGAKEEMTAEVRDATARLWRFWFIPVLLASAVLALIAAYILTRPLRRLKDAAAQLARGNYSVDVDVVGPSEVGELANTFRDMTEQIRRRERDLREKLAWMDTILANAADGIITFDQTGRIEQANRAAEEMFGYGHGKLEGERVKQLMPMPDHLNKPTSLASLAAANPYGGTVARLWSAVKTPGEEHRGLRKDGSSFWMEVTFSRVPLEDRSIVTAIFRDITRRKLDEERIRKLNDELDARVKLRTAQLEDTKTKLEIALAEAENASAAKDRFISVVSHELRTPLTSAMGYTELLLNPRAEKLRQAPLPTLNKVLTSCKHLLTLINDLLDIGRYTAGKPIDLALSRFELSGFLRGVLEMIAPLVKRNDNVLESHLPDHEGEVTNDETRLRQILLNLLSNASKFTEKGKVSLDVERRPGSDGERVIFRVRDTGPGMTREQLDKLFTPFYRVDNSTTRRQGGTGLGLTITRMLAELMGGTIRVESTPGVGSTFTVDLPVEARPTLVPVRVSPHDRGVGEKKRGSLSAGGVVLVIDDDASVRQILADYLIAEGYQVEQAASGPKGIEKARELHPVCITLDVLMPGQDGWTTLAQLKSDPHTQNIPVIMLTILEDRNLGFTVGATEYITKPIDWGRLGTLLCQYAPGPAPILIVEDDASQRDYMREELLLAGWKVLEAGNGIEALQKCDNVMPGLILLDLMMPVMDGFAFLEELRHRPGGGNVPVLVVTARDLTDEERRRLNRSLAQVLARESLTREQLLDRIREQMPVVTR